MLGYLISFLLLSQIVLAKQAYDLPGICHPDTTDSPDDSLRGHSLVVVSLEIYFQGYRPAAII